MDFKDENGKITMPGKYAIKLVAPENFEYSYNGIEIKTLPVSNDMWNERYEFNLEKRDSY